MAAPGRAGLDVGCGLGTEVAWLTALGLQAIGIDISEVACARAQLLHPEALFLYADVRRLPFADGVFDLALDRGCFHYLKPSDRARYASEVGRVLRPGGRLLLRASLRRAGRRNDLDEPELRRTFAAWRVRGLGAELIPSDTRSMEVLVARLERP